MSWKAHGQVRRSQVITTWGPGALLDLPKHSVIVGGLETWPKPDDLDPVMERRLASKLQSMTGVESPQLYQPPAGDGAPWEAVQGIGVYRFPQWFVVQEHDKDPGVDSGRERSRRLVHRKALDDKGRFEGLDVVPTRFVRACARGHVDDLDWRAFVHGPDDPCRRQLRLAEYGTGGDLSDLVVQCACGRKRKMLDAADRDSNALGTCPGRRPWLGQHACEPCSQQSRLLIRTATNSYFPQVVSALSLPERGSAVQDAVIALWERLSIVDSSETLAVIKKYPDVAEKLAPFGDDEILEAIQAVKQGTSDVRPVKLVELDAILAAPPGYGDDVPLDPDFHARRLPDSVWRGSSISDGVESVIQLHRLREVLALAGFTRFEAVTPNIDGEFDSDVQIAQLALEPRWFPAVENRGEGVFIQLRGQAVAEWLERPAVQERLDSLAVGHERWLERRTRKRPFPGGPYILLHTLSHLLLQSLAMTCGYPASSIRERVYADSDAARFGILLYTGTPDAEGTLGGLVQEARRMEWHLEYALRLGALCSNDPICSQHLPGRSLEERWLHGAACHGCTLIAETSCEMRNDYLDRALVVPVLGVADAAYFTPRA